MAVETRPRRIEDGSGSAPADLVERYFTDVYATCFRILGRTHDAFEKSVVARLRFPEGMLLPQARPFDRLDALRVLAAVEESLPDLEKALTPEEPASLRDAVAKGKPKK